jgi:predicted Zn finger-like uncharacterized protein
MVIQCPSCKKQYNVESSQIKDQGVKITCPSCKHQFIVRKKTDELEKTQSDNKPKTPPCEICGEPSTHVFKGPPPKPLCEHHYEIEKQKETRFFESKPGITEKPPKREPVSDPAATQVSQSPDATVQAQAPPKGAVEPTMADSEDFGDFEDDFEFFDQMDSNAAAPDQTQPLQSVPKPAAPPPPPKPENNETEENFTASPHEFLEEGGGVSEANQKEEDFEFDDMDDDMDGKTQPPGGPDPFAPSPSDSIKIFDEDDEASASSEDAPDPFSADAMMDDGPDPFGPEDSTEPAPTPTPQETPGFTKESFNLDGSVSDDKYAGYEDQDDSFEWKKPLEGENGESPALANLDAEFKSSMMSSPNPPSGASSVQSVKTKGANAVALAPGNQKTFATALITMALVLFSTGASAYISFSGISNQMPAQIADFDIEVPAWEGDLINIVQDGKPKPSIGHIAPLEGNEAPGKSGGAAKVAVNTQKAFTLMMEDTPKSYDKAVLEIDKAISLNPDSPDLAALKVDILSFQETIDAKGKTFLRSKQAKRELELQKSISGKPVFIRSKAFIFLNEKQTAAARALISKYLEKNPKDYVSVYILAMTYVHQPKPDLSTAAKHMEKAIKLEPYFIRGHWELASIYRGMGRHDDAINVYNKVLTSTQDRAGVAEAMENTLREKSSGTKKPTDDGPSETVAIIEPKPKRPKGINATGTAMSENIMQAINEAAPHIRKLVLKKKGVPKNPVTGGVFPSKLAPPEEAPR